MPDGFDHFALIVAGHFIGTPQDGIGVRRFLRYSVQGGFMSILATIRREEKKVKKQLAKLQADLNGLQLAAKALGQSASRDLTSAKKRVLSAAGRAKISKAAKKRWAKIKSQAKKAVA
jgi:hypothetical protein